MGRIRTIKPEFFKHADLYDAEIETGLPLRLAFAGMWTCCDREGRFKWRPRELKIDVLPYDECDFSRVLDALATRGFVVKYASGTEFFGFIPSWKEHQFINNKELQSSIPNPISCQQLDALATREPRVEDANGTRGVKEGKGKEGKGGDTRVDDASPKVAPPEDPEDEIPEGLELSNYVTGIMERFGMTSKSAYAVYVALMEAIPMLAKDEGCSIVDAARRMLSRMREADRLGNVKWRWWIGEDAKWKQKAAFSLGMEDDSEA